jgi:GNAT superfamily N-acetyltransferase
MTTTAIASTDRHLEEILALQRRYHARSVSAEVQAVEGFVFAEHTLPLLRRMAAQSPQAIALSGGHVVGYCLSLPLSLQTELPSLAPMFEQFEACEYRGKPLSAYRYAVGGQVCVDREHRGKGLLARLYEQLRVSLGEDFDLCVTEIATRNRVSVRAHERMGFETISTYTDMHEEWVIVAWDLTRPAVLGPGGLPPT